MSGVGYSRVPSPSTPATSRRVRGRAEAAPQPQLSSLLCGLCSCRGVTRWGYMADRSQEGGGAEGDNHR